MKKLLFSLTMLIAMFFVACDTAPTTQEAEDFNDKVINDQFELLDLNSEFKYAYPNDNIGDAEDALDKLETFVEDKADEYETMEAFDKEDIFRTAFLDLLDDFDEIIKDYYKLLEMREQWENGGEDDVIEDILDFQDEIDGVTEEANSTFLESQKDFAAQYEFELEEKEE